MKQVTASPGARAGVRAESVPRPTLLLAAAGFAFCLLVIASAVQMALSERQSALRNSGANLTNLSMALADQVDGLITSLEVAEERLVDHLALDPDQANQGKIKLESSERLHDLLLDISSGLPDVHHFTVIDAQGTMCGLSAAYPTPVRNLADREYFGFAHSHPEIRTFITEPNYSRQTGLPSFYVARRLSAPDGRFQGVLLAAIQTTYLTHRFQALKLGEGSTISLLRNDGVMLVREPPLPLETFQAKRAELRALVESLADGGIKHLVGIDGVERLAAFTIMPRHGLLLAVSQPCSSVLGAWRIKLAWLSLAALLVCSAVGIIIFATWRGIRNQQRLEVSEATRHAAAEHNARLARAVDTMGHGLMMYSRTDHLVLANSAACKILGVPENALRPGMTLFEIVHVLAKAGIVAEPIDDTIARYAETLREQQPKKSIRALADGRFLSVCYMPSADGGLFTFEDVSESRAAEARVAHMAHHDSLTGLPNRLELRARTEKALENVDREPFALMCLDLDHFKNINDTLGHPAGDKLLREVGARIRQITRDTDTVARLGGDEFAVLARPSKGRIAVARLADRLIESTSKPYAIDGQLTFIGVSIGISLAPEDVRDGDQLMRQADMALYRAKSEGRGRHAFFEASMEQRAAERRLIEAEMRAALAAGQFELYFQPLVSAATRRVIGFEALLRWRHPERGLILPGAFIPIAEESGLIVEIGAWALRAACQVAAGWPGYLNVAVNLSPVQFLDGALVGAVATALQASGLAPSRLELEITESTMMRDIDVALATLSSLKRLGVGIAMDDFGTGYSSLAHLQRFPFDKVKIDQAFIREIAQSQNLAILRAVTHIAQSMGIRTTAEGVETEAQLASILSVGCDELQGYLFGKPLHVDGLMQAVADIDGMAPELAAREGKPAAPACKLAEGCGLRPLGTSSPCGQVPCPRPLEDAELGEIA